MYHKISRLVQEHADELEEWFSGQENHLKLPIFSSYDVRNAGYKAVVIDANVYPAGFNNVCAESHDKLAQAFRSFIESNFPGTKQIGLIAESSTNPYYYDNIITIKELLEMAGYDILVGMLEGEEAKVISKSKGSIFLKKYYQEHEFLKLGGLKPDLLVINDDFAKTNYKPLVGIKQPVTPKAALGWYQRRKHHHFNVTNNLIIAVADILGIDPWLISAYFDFVLHVDFKEKMELLRIGEAVERCIKLIQIKYDQYGIKEKPFVFVKGSASTYGMNAIPFSSKKSFLAINARQRSKMDRAKGGRKVTEVIIQEGVRTMDEVKGSVAEPVVYCIGNRPVGGFFRIHKGKTCQENLNTRGMEFKPDLFCPKIPINEHIYKDSNVTKEKLTIYRFLARLGVIAIGKELEDLQ